MEDRPAVRILCVGAEARVLLLQWQDPVDGRVFWEPPGGGIEAGESAIEAARRELEEETGLPGSAVVGPVANVERDHVWAGRHRVGVEPFFLAEVGDARAGPLALTEEEQVTLLDRHWWAPEELRASTSVFEPPGLADLLARHVGRAWA